MRTIPPISRKGCRQRKLPMKRKLTRSEIDAYGELARAAGKLRRAQRRAERRMAQRERDRQARKVRKGEGE